MRYLSVCSGIEAATVAWHPLGWTPFAFSEIGKFPAALLAHYYPDTPNLGDMTKFKEWPDADIDVLVGGTPCQSFSVAGLRAGLDDPRGNLMLTYLAIAGRYRPDWLVWENVPGVLSSNGGRDFAAFLRGLEELGYGWSYRVLDAQYFGVPQRRRRVFVVGHLGGWRRAAAVLFERHGLEGNPAPRREARQTAPTVPARRTAGGGLELVPIAFHNRQDPDISGDVTHPIGAQDNGMGIVFTQNQRDEVRELAVAGALAAEPGMKQQTYVAFQPKQVRRLTPRECERLQGFPDDYTLIPYRWKLSADDPRYNALGNSMAVPVMRWIGRRIAAVSAIREKVAA